MQRKEQLETEVIPTNEEEAEEFAKAIMQRAASLKVVKIDRGTFLRSEIKGLAFFLCAAPYQYLSFRYEASTILRKK